MGLLFVIASLALGMFISTLARTQQQAMQVAFFFVLPNILLSGFMFPRQAMPQFFQWIGLLLPLTYFLKVLRGILLKGVGIASLWREVAALAAFAAGLGEAAGAAPAACSQQWRGCRASGSFRRPLSPRRTKTDRCRSATARRFRSPTWSPG